VAGARVTAPPSTGISKPSHNTDAIDVHGTPFHVHDCHFDTGDDNIAAHANHTLVENCVFGTGHGASIGSLCDVWLTNITFRNISFAGTTAGARIKVRDGCETGRVWGVTFEDLTMKDVETPIDVTMFYDADKPQGKGGFVIEDVTFRNIKSSGHKTDGDFLCTTASPCRGIELEDVSFDGDKTWTCKDASGKSASGCECFTGTTGTASHVAPDVGACLGPSPPPSPSPPGCDVDGCLARCFAKYGGDASDLGPADYCAKGCAQREAEGRGRRTPPTTRRPRRCCGVKGGAVTDKSKLCKDAAAERFSKCNDGCASASSEQQRVAECQYGCGFWK
jgi:hypothetical protein